MRLINFIPRLAEGIAISMFVYLRTCKNFYINHFAGLVYLIKIRAPYKEIRNYIWALFNVPDVGGWGLRRLWNRLPWLTPYPREIEVEVTTKCHLNCIICERTHWKTQDKKLEISYEQFIKMMEQFPDMRCINLTGEGSSFLNKDYMRMLKYCKSRQMYVLFVESFDRLKKDVIEEIVDIRINRLELSMDAATKETFETIKVKANWERVLENLKIFRSLKIEKKSPLPYFYIRYIFMKPNMEEIVPFVKLISELDLNTGRPTRIDFTGLLTFPEIEHLFVPEVPLKIINEANCLAKKLKNV
ncbi:MAG: radical SAM protein, partial [bacterium]